MASPSTEATAPATASQPINDPAPAPIMSTDPAAIYPDTSGTTGSDQGSAIEPDVCRLLPLFLLRHLNTLTTDGTQRYRLGFWRWHVRIRSLLEEVYSISIPSGHLTCLRG